MDKFLRQTSAHAKTLTDKQNKPFGSAQDQQKLLKIARALIGTPYKYGATPESDGIPKYLDCSSFTQYVYKQIGIDIPRSTILQAAKAGTKIQLSITNYQLLNIGDLLFFRGSKGHYNDELFPEKKVYIGHVTLYIGSNKVLHGSSKKGKISEEKLKNLINKMGNVTIAKRII